MSGDQRIKLLLLSVGGMPGQNALDALEGRRDRVQVVGTNCDPWNPRNYRCDKVYLVPRSDEEPAFSERIFGILRTEAPDLVLAGRDQDVLAMASWWERHPHLRSRLACGGLVPARIMHDKFLSFCFARERGLPFADSALGGRELDALLARHGFPLLAKPRDGFGSADVYAVHDPHQLEALCAAGGFLFQEYLEPPAELDRLRARLAFGTPLQFSIPEERQYACQVVVSPAGELSEVCCTLNRMQHGMGQKVERVAEPVLEALVRAYAKGLAALGWAGPFNLQCKRVASGGFVPFELNGRMTATSSARLRLGFDELGSLVRLFRGEDRLGDLSAPLRRGRWIFKTMADAAVREADTSRLLEKGEWTPSS